MNTIANIKAANYDLFDEYVTSKKNKPILKLPLAKLSDDGFLFDAVAVEYDFAPSMMIATGFLPSKKFRGDNLNRVFGNYDIKKRIRGKNKAGVKGSLAREVLEFRAMETLRTTIESEQFSFDIATVSLLTMLMLDRLRLMSEDEDPIALAEACCSIIRMKAGVKKVDRNESQKQSMRLLRAKRKVSEAELRGEELSLGAVLAEMEVVAQVAEERKANRQKEKVSAATLDDSDFEEEDTYACDLSDDDDIEKFVFTVDPFTSSSDEDNDVSIIEDEQSKLDNMKF